MIIVVRDALDGRSFPEAGDYVYNLMLPFAVSSNFASADFRKIKTYNFQKS